VILYNVTVKVDHAVHQDWLAWMQQTHIPEVLATGFFVEGRLWKLLDQDESDGLTYAVQYKALSMEQYEAYRDGAAPALQAAHRARYGDQCVAFRSLLESV
jgi:hypothetical protein